MEEGVSRKHARILRSAEGKFELTDLGSTNGTYLNGTRLAGPGRLDEGDRVQLGGQCSLRFTFKESSDGDENLREALAAAHVATFSLDLRNRIIELERDRGAGGGSARGHAVPLLPADDGLRPRRRPGACPGRGGGRGAGPAAAGRRVPLHPPRRRGRAVGGGQGQRDARRGRHAAAHRRDADGRQRPEADRAGAAARGAALREPERRRHLPRPPGQRRRLEQLGGAALRLLQGGGPRACLVRRAEALRAQPPGHGARRAQALRALEPRGGGPPEGRFGDVLRGDGRPAP